jgi:hypothetical protein
VVEAGVCTGRRRRRALPPLEAPARRGARVRTPSDLPRTLLNSPLDLKRALLGNKLNPWVGPR